MATPDHTHTSPRRPLRISAALVRFSGTALVTLTLVATTGMVSARAHGGEGVEPAPGFDLTSVPVSTVDGATVTAAGTAGASGVFGLVALLTIAGLGYVAYRCRRSSGGDDAVE